MSTRILPARPNLDQLKLQASELHGAHRKRDRSAGARIAAHHPDRRQRSADQVLDAPFALADAQLVVAREYGFTNWAALKHHVDTIGSLSQFTPHPRFAEALAALDAGDSATLARLIASDPALVHARTNLEPPYDYFTGATLLHHVAGNPDRDVPLPSNIVDLARLLIDGGADVHARTLGPNGGAVMGLLITSRRASDTGVAGPLMDLLLEKGAQLDVHAEGALDMALANGAAGAAEKMIELGAQADVIVAAALGRLDLLRAAFDDEGRLRSRPRRDGKVLSDRDATGLAALFAYVREQRGVVDYLLEKDGNWNVTGVGNGTFLHRAAWNGDLEIVKRLVARGADISVRDPAFGASPLAWASYNTQRHVFDWMTAHCPIDLHDAVSFGLRQHVESRLREDPAAVDARRDQWKLPQAAPLHCAAAARRADMARILLERGADPDSPAGNGMTPLDVADYEGASSVGALLEARGGSRSAGAEKSSRDPKLKRFEKLAKDVLEAYRSGAEAAIQRLQDAFGARLTGWGIRRAVRVRLQKGRTSGEGTDPSISLAEARDVVAGAQGFGSWAQLADSVTRLGRAWGRPLYSIDRAQNRLEIRRPVADAEWDEIIALIGDRQIEGLDAAGQMSDAVMARIGELHHLTRLQLAGSRRLTDVGLRHLSRLPRLRWLNLSGCSFTDEGLSVLRQLPALGTFELHWHKGVSDGGIAHLVACERLERVDVMGSPLGDGLLEALAGKRHLRYLKTGTRVTDAGLPLLHQIPAFKAWQGGEVRYSLMSADAEPNHLLLDGPFTDAGLKALRGLDGLFGLSFFWHSLAFTDDGLAALAGLANLGFVGCEGARCTDAAMRHFAAIPTLRMLMAQGTVATDSGFAALSRSSTLEYLWGRECPNLTGNGFSALGNMPSLRGLAVSCRRVDEAALSTLPRFPALRELMPMDVRDEDFRHVGRCERLEALWCMYCRSTTDVATEQIAALPQLQTYYAGETKITDRSLEILSRMSSLEALEFWNCAGITNAGAAMLASLPRLREAAFDSCRHVSPDVVSAFPPHVRVRHTS